MTVTNMSLHRIIAEIKAIEAKLSSIQSNIFVQAVITEDTVQIGAFKTASQSVYDKIVSQMANLAALKAARNKANSTTTVVINGDIMTIDEALSKKASAPYQLTLINTLQNQFVQAQRQIEVNIQQIEQKINQQMTAMFSGTKKATEDEIKMIRQAAERNQKAVILHADGLKERLEAMKKDFEGFNLEVDFILSEVNATTKVDVKLV